MMIIPLAETLQNCLQNLTSRIAGLDNEQMTGRTLGMGAMFGYGINAIKEQFKTPNSNNEVQYRDNNNVGGFKGLVTRAKSVINPNVNLNSETDYNGNSIREVLPNKNRINQPNVANKNIENKENKVNAKEVVGNVAKVGYKATKAYLKAGESLVEGRFKNNSYEKNINNKINYQNTEYIKIEEPKEIGDENGDKE